jgi:hypothetical protein
VSSESIASPPARAGATESCASCGAPLAGDQRYCLECGERRSPVSGALLGGVAPAANAGPVESPPVPPGPPASAGAALSPAAGAASPVEASRGNGATVIAGVGVLLLAMGVGVLIGRSGGGAKQNAAAPQVISVATAPTAGGASASGSPAASFVDDWPAGTDGYTVQLQTLAQASTQQSAVQAAKAAASAKGAKDVGALRSEDFASLTAGHYVIYSGVFHKRTEADKALGGLKQSFAGASVIRVASSGAGLAGAAAGAGGGSGAAGGAGRPAPSKAAEDLTKSHGKSYEEKSKNLPNQVET